MNRFTVDNMNDMIEQTVGDEWVSEDVTMAFNHSFEKKVDKKLVMRVAFDGRGNSIVRFVVSNHGKSITYEKYDSAVGAYNTIGMDGV